MYQSIFYVDIENMQDVAKEAVTEAMNHWPEDFPKPGVIKLYARADQTEMWKIWISHYFSSIEVQVKGVQHYSLTNSKNSADILLAIDAITDVLKGSTKYVAILSDDSDFANLFAAIKQETLSSENPEVPFRWFMTNRPDTRSSILTDFFPAEYIQTVGCSAPAATPKKPKSTPSTVVPKEKNPASLKLKKTVPVDTNNSEEDAIVKTIMKNIKAGPFKSADCQKIIKQHFPQNPLSIASSAAFGTQFSKDIWPILEKYGVLLPNPNHKPRKYEMTDEAKNKVAYS